MGESRKSPLLIAAENGDLGGVIDCLDLSADIEERDAVCNTTLQKSKILLCILP